jgi:hypothetical protein
MKGTFSTIAIVAFTLLIGCSSHPSDNNIPNTLLLATSTTKADTVTASYTPTATRTALPTNTNTPAITSTFDPANIITRTPSVAETCPQIADVPVPKISKPDYSVLTFKDNEQIALVFLNEGGNPEILLKAIKDADWLNHWKNNTQIKDITGDGILEIIVSPSETYVFGCKSGKYEILLKVDNEGIAINGEQNQIIAIEDMNLDAVPELVVASYGGNFVRGLDGWIYEWDGKQFITKLEMTMDGRQTSGDIPTLEVKNSNDDSLLELVAAGGILGGFDYYYYFPWRQETNVYMWNGNEFVYASTSFSNPQFRYQVVQDGDRATLNGDYDKAIKIYENAIYGNYDWFSQARKQYFIDNASGIVPLTEPEPDPNEQPNLAGYSFFRIILTYVLHEEMDEAQTAYERIHKNLAKGSTGYDHLLIADAFWNEYQSTQDVAKACKKAIEYASEHPDILKYLDSDYHNTFQDIMYEPEDICPFR